jgi:serine/threonine protein kinase
LASKLKEHNPVFAKAWVQNILTLSYDNVYNPVISAEAYKLTFMLNERLLEYISNPLNIGKEENSIEGIKDDIVKFLTGQQSKKSPEEKNFVQGYEILEILQQETNFTEYLVKEEGNSPIRRRVKEYALQVLGMSPEELRIREDQIKNQYNALKNLKNKPFILNVEFLVDNENHLFYEISDFMDENSLRSEARHKTFTFKEKLQIIDNVMVALREAHQKGIFHRDVNPENIYLASGYAYLGNFGKSYFLDHNEEGYTVMPTINQTNATAYHPLELTVNDANASSDIYSLGVLVYWLFTEKEPFTSPYALDKMGGKIPDNLLPSKINPNLPKWLDEVCLKTILTDDQQRLQTVEELQKLIADAIQSKTENTENVEHKPFPSPSSPTFEELKEGDTIGTYTIHRVLGKGGYSKVFKVKHRIQDKFFTLKLFNESVNFNSVKDEYDALKDLNHKNIVKFVWNDEAANGQFYTVMEFLDGENLSHYTRTDARLPLNKVLQLGKDILSALVEMQSKEKPIMHRDIKPQNIIWDKGERFVLIDFNVASSNTQNKDFVGTNPYLAPDLIHENYQVHWDKSADLFALGVTLYELACKQYPWHPKKTPRLSEVPNDPKSFEPKISRKFADFLLKAIATDKEVRFKNALEMQDALLAIEDNILEDYSGSEDGLPTTNRLYHTQIFILYTLYNFSFEKLLTS